MLVISYIRDHREEVIERLSIKNFTNVALIDEILKLDDERRATKKQCDETLAALNNNARAIGDLYKQGKAAEANEMKAKNNEMKELAKTLNDRYEELQQVIQTKLVEIPNTPRIDVPRGTSAADNVNVHQEGDMPELFEGAKPHWELLSQYELADFDLGNKVTGAGFPFYKGKGAKLQRALINFFLNTASEHGYTEVQPPYVVNEASAYATGQLPDKEGQMYHADLDNLYLIPTAEVPVTNIYRDTILKASDFPIKNCAYSACFRREAGSYGKDVRGLNRLHQFDKVEIVQVEHPDRSYQTLEEMKQYGMSLLQKLGLPFRVLRLCGGDISFTSALTYDLEVYSRAQRRWLEVSSISNFESYQANRLHLRFKDENGKTRLAHTLNGSALALPRVMAALIENNQTPDGIIVPEVLRPYTGFDIIC